jgi:4-hydroxy-tetrahydrodipicolinate synthase
MEMQNRWALTVQILYSVFGILYSSFLEGSEMRTRFTGCGTALVTPFTRSGALDKAAIRRLVKRQVDGGVHFLVPCGTTGENPTLSRAEHLRTVELVIEETNGRVPVLAGAGGYNTREIAELAAEMQRLGADGLLSVTPYYNKPTAEGLFQHFRAIAESTRLPIVVYNVPGRTGCNVEPGTLARLATIPNVVGVKEASGNLSQVCEVCRVVPDDFIVLSGDDPLTLPMMAVGAKGVVSVASNEVPHEMAQMVEAAERNDFAAARVIHSQLLLLMQVNFTESNPIPVKAAMAAMGLIEEAYRLPMVPPRPESREKILTVLRELQLLAMPARKASA